MNETSFVTPDWGVAEFPWEDSPSPAASESASRARWDATARAETRRQFIGRFGNSGPAQRQPLGRVPTRSPRGPVTPRLRWFDGEPPPEDLEMIALANRIDSLTLRVRYRGWATRWDKRLLTKLHDEYRTKWTRRRARRCEFDRPGCRTVSSDSHLFKYIYEGRTYSVQFGAR